VSVSASKYFRQKLNKSSQFITSLLGGSGKNKTDESKKTSTLMCEGLPKQDHTQESRAKAAKTTGTKRQYVSDTQRLRKNVRYGAQTLKSGQP